ncbi:hypothetical protein DFH06DRAFT_1143783 [Mycena polygramma]|nr:hypothetical protein DFH06DRAFT_1143783 [Mycena polygramma]
MRGKDEEHALNQTFTWLGVLFGNEKGDACNNEQSFAQVGRQDNDKDVIEGWTKGKAFGPIASQIMACRCLFPAWKTLGMTDLPLGLPWDWGSPSPTLLVTPPQTVLKAQSVVCVRNLRMRSPPATAGHGILDRFIRTASHAVNLRELTSMVNDGIQSEVFERRGTQHRYSSFPADADMSQARVALDQKKLALDQDNAIGGESNPHFLHVAKVVHPPLAGGDRHGPRWLICTMPQLVGTNFNEVKIFGGIQLDKNEFAPKRSPGGKKTAGCTSCHRAESNHQLHPNQRFNCPSQILGMTSVVNDGAGVLLLNSSVGKVSKVSTRKFSHRRFCNLNYERDLVRRLWSSAPWVMPRDASDREGCCNCNGARGSALAALWIERDE